MRIDGNCYEDWPVGVCMMMNILGRRVLVGCRDGLGLVVGIGGR